MKELLKPMCGLLVFITLIFMMMFSLIGVCYSFDSFMRDRQQRARTEIKQNVFPPAVIEGTYRVLDYKYGDKSEIKHHEVEDLVQAVLPVLPLLHPADRLGERGGAHPRHPAKKRKGVVSCSLMNTW